MVEQNENLRKKFTVINKFWIYFCNVFFCNLRPDEFLYEKMKENKYYSHKNILDVNYERINEFYSVDEKKISQFLDELRMKNN